MQSRITFSLASKLLEMGTRTINHAGTNFHPGLSIQGKILSDYLPLLEETLVINPLTTTLYFALFQAGLYDAPGILHMNSFPSFLSPANFDHICQFCEWNPRANKGLEYLCLDVAVPSSLGAQPLVHGSHSWTGTLNSLNRSQGEHGHLKMQPQKDPCWTRTAKNKPRGAKHTFELAWK